MNPIKTSEIQDFCATSAHARQDKQNDSNKLAKSKKVYKHRNSPLTDMMQVDHLQCVYNITVAACILLFLNITIFYLAEPVKLWEDLNIMKWMASRFPYFAMFWLLFNLFAFAVYEGFKLWITVRNRIHSKVADRIFLLLYTASFILIPVVTASFMFEMDLLPICGLTAAFEQLRICMKIHSFVRENIPRVMQYKPQKDGSQHHALYPTRKHYLYYLFAPVLIYRDSYPRSQNRQWGNVFYNLYKFCLCIFVTYCIFMRFIVDVFKDVGIRPFTKTEIVLIIAKSLVSGSMMIFITFYSILHCWLNAFAELLMFGDREFYQDWWNSTTFSQFYRRWNIAVHDWCYAYVYTDFQKLGCSHSVSMILVFFLSALFHEYLMSLTVGYCYPVVFVLYSTQILFIFITKQRTTHYWNIFMWCIIFSGSGTLVCLIASEWYARINCPKKGNHLNFFMPRSWDPSCNILNFS